MTNKYQSLINEIERVAGTIAVQSKRAPSYILVNSERCVRVKRGWHGKVFIYYETMIDAYNRFRKGIV